MTQVNAMKNDRGFSAASRAHQKLTFADSSAALLGGGSLFVVGLGLLLVVILIPVGGGGPI